MVSVRDGPHSSHFSPLPFQGNVSLTELPERPISDEMRAALEHAPGGDCVSWGIPFKIDRVALLVDRPLTVRFEPANAEWLVFMHTSDIRPLEWNEHGFVSPMRGRGRLNEHAADYVVLFDDGTEERLAIRRRYQIGAFQRQWGENCSEAVSHRRPRPMRAHHEQLHALWGRSQTRADVADGGEWVNWLWAWENQHSHKAIVGMRFEPVSGAIVVSGISYGRASSLPLRWSSRRKGVLTLPAGQTFLPELDEEGLLNQIQLDLGQVISAQPRAIYPNAAWTETHNNQVPEISPSEAIIEYAAHPDACFHLSNGDTVPVAEVETPKRGIPLRAVSPATQRVTLRAVEKGSANPVPVKLHVHGGAGEYLAPIDRHRIPNAAWFEDYGVDFVHLGSHYCTYIPGETRIDLPLGRVYVEISKGFEISPVRRVVEVTPGTKEILIEIERVLPWRERGWVSADTHVHFLSPISALLEGSAEGVNVVNLLASQWGELMTNVGDFDGKTTWGARETGGDGEYLVRVGTENRQHVLGHISLLGYKGNIIAPMTTGGPNESALGDPIEVLLTEWARRCHEQGGVVVLPHFPNPRAEHAATIVEGEADAVEMTSWGDLYSGINPYSLADWYRYLNCGYMVGAAGGTDKMSASTAVGTVRTYAHIDPERAFDYQAWMAAMRRGETFVTYGPLLEFAVDGKAMGSRIRVSSSGGTVDVTWEVASVSVPMSRVELIVNGEIRESVAVGPRVGTGQWSVKVDRSSWMALLVRGHHQGHPDIIAAHSSPVMVEVDGSPFYAAADALTILEQIEGALAYIDTVGTRAQTRAYRRMRMVLESSHRSVHNRMHEMGYFHKHTPPEDHAEHH